VRIVIEHDRRAQQVVDDFANWLRAQRKWREWGEESAGEEFADEAWDELWDLAAEHDYRIWK